MTNSERELLYVDDLPASLHLRVGENEILRLSIASLAKEALSDIVVDVEKGGLFDGAFADFSSMGSDFKLAVRLLGENASFTWRLSAMSRQKTRKKFVVSATHSAPKTSATVANYGIARDESVLTFSGVSNIEKGARQSFTRQDADIIVFDKGADGFASPALKIDENDVSASHGAVIGRLNEQHLFYLESRGLSPESAKHLIALGYLRPVLSHFRDERVLARLNAAIEEGFVDD